MRDKRKTGRGAEKGHVEILKEALIPFGLSLYRSTSTVCTIFLLNMYVHATDLEPVPRCSFHFLRRTDDNY